MNETLTITELERRWKKTLAATEKAVSRHPEVYREIKLLVGDIVTKTLDINDYPFTAEKLGGLLRTMEEGGEKISSFFLRQDFTFQYQQAEAVAVGMPGSAGTIKGF